MAWTVKREAGRKIEWKDIQTFGSAREADDWISEQSHASGLPITDYTIAERKDGKGWTVRQRIGRKIEWEILRRFESIGDAADWIYGSCRMNGFPIEAYIISGE